MIKKVKKILKNFDYFAVRINFHYNSKKRYHSVTGGLIFFLFILSSLIYIFLHLSAFINRKNISIIYYDSQINGTDIINFDKYNLSFAFGLECENYEKYFSNLDEIYNIFIFSLKYVKTTRDNNNFIKTKESISFHKCNKSDFYNNFNETYEILGLNNYYCPDNKSHLIKGFYRFENFFYYEITISAKNLSYSLYEKIFSDGNCKFSFYFTEFSININNFYHPFSKQIHQKFSQLTPVEFIKKDIFFILNKFDSYEGLLFDSSKLNFFISFSKENDYVNYKGKKRFESKIEDYEKFAKFYLKADSKRIEIVRKYMKINEFFAEMLSLFSGILFLLRILVGMLNNFYAYNSIMKKIFLFKTEHEFKLRRSNKAYYQRFSVIFGESKDNIDKNSVFKKMKKLYNESKILTTKLKQKLFKEEKKNNRDENDDETQNANANFFVLKHRSKTNKNIIKKDNTILSYDNNNNNLGKDNNNNNLNIKKNIFNCLSSDNFEDKNKNNNINNSAANNNITNSSNEMFFSKKSNSVFKGPKTERPEILINNLTTLKKNNTFKFNPNDQSFYNKKYKKFNVLDAKMKKKKNNFSANVIPNLKLNCIEILLTLFCPFCANHRLAKKIMLLNNGKKKFFINLDILTYLKTLQQIQVLNYILFEEYQINLIEFISKPCISLVNEYSNEKFDEQNENLEIVNFFESYKKLIKKKNKKDVEIKLSEIIEKEMKKLLE